jgi:hypothetical protein
MGAGEIARQGLRRSCGHDPERTSRASEDGEENRREGSREIGRRRA